MSQTEAWITVILFIISTVFAVRVFIRRPRRASQIDPPGFRSIAMFSGDDPTLLADDDPDGYLVGNRLFDELCDRLAARDDLEIESRGQVDNARQAVCRSMGNRYALVLEWVDPRWAISVEWTPKTGAERRHQRWIHAVYAPEETPGLKHLLLTIDRTLKEHELLSDVGWHLRQRWAEEQWGDPEDLPCES